MGSAQYADIRVLDGELRPRSVRRRRRWSGTPCHEEVDAVIVGAGLGGLQAAARLAQQGVTNVRIIDKAGDFGGTWYWNRYPGAACDVESYIYLPMLEETGYIPTEKYAKAPEIFAHCQRIAEQFDLYPRALFQTNVTELRWLDDAGRWQVTTDRGDRILARFAVVAGGILHRAKLPRIPGVETFRGTAFHTSRWNYDYTGGSPYRAAGQARRQAGGPDRHRGDLGAGLPAARRERRARLPVPAHPLGRRGARQPADRPGLGRAASNRAGTRNGSRTSPASSPARRSTPTWWPTGGPRSSARNPNAMGLTTPEEHQIDLEQTNAVRARIDSIVQDPTTAEALKPWYNMLCKRPCFHDEYLPAFNQPNVTLLDTDGQGVERITETRHRRPRRRVPRRLHHLRLGLRRRAVAHLTAGLRDLRPLTA